MKPHILMLGIAGLLVGMPIDVTLATGGRIVSAALTNGQMQLWFDSASGYSYQVQASSVSGTKCWADALPRLTATGNLTTASLSPQGQAGFYKVLEFTNNVFWYDGGTITTPPSSAPGD